LWQTTNFSQQLSPEFFARFVSATDKVACTTTTKNCDDLSCNDTSSLLLESALLTVYKKDLKSFALK